MTNATDAIRTRINTWLPPAKKQVTTLNTMIETLTGAARITAVKHRDELQHQITVLERELNEPVTDAHTQNSLGNVEMGGLS